MTDALQTDGDDAEINAAIAEAQRRLSEFRRVVEEDSRRIIPGYHARPSANSNQVSVVAS